MTPDQAIQLLNQATAGITTDRASHAKIVEAVNVLTALVNGTRLSPDGLRSVPEATGDARVKSEAPRVKDVVLGETLTSQI